MCDNARRFADEERELEEYRKTILEKRFEAAERFKKAVGKRIWFPEKVKRDG